MITQWVFVWFEMFKSFLYCNVMKMPNTIQWNSKQKFVWPHLHDALSAAPLMILRSSFHYHLVLRPNFFTSFDISSTDVLRTHLLYYKNAYVQKTRPKHHFYIWWLSDQEFDESQKLHAQKIFLLYSTCMFSLFWLHCSYHCLQTIKILGEITPMKHHQFIYSGLWTR